MLDSHSRIAAGPESHLFSARPLDLGDLSFKFDIDTHVLRTIFRQCDTRTAFVEAFADKYLQRRRKVIWADKTSRNVYRFDYIRQHFPNAILIHVVRDGRDVVSSLRTHPKWKIQSGMRVETHFIRAWEDCVSKWILACDVSKRFQGDARYLEIRYEDLVTNTEQQLRQLCNLLDIAFDPKMLEYHACVAPSRNPLKFPQNFEATQPLYDESIGRWRRDIPGDELRWIEPLIEPYLRYLGYDV
jgi:hypothetical protein